ncbi:hypothetical protein KR093_001179, partial [Drosophila rubida]
WYRVNVYSKVSLDLLSIDEIIYMLKEECAIRNTSWKPLYMEEGGELLASDTMPPKFNFFVRTYGQLKVLQDMQMPEEYGITIRAKSRTPQPEINNEFKLKIREIIMKRYTADESNLDLCSVVNDPIWGDVYGGLNNAKCMAAAIEVMGECMPRLHNLSLDLNYLDDVLSLEGIENHLPELRNLSLVSNNLQTIQSLKVLSHLPLVELSLGMNPLRKPADPSELLTFLPHLRILN